MSQSPVPEFVLAELRRQRQKRRKRWLSFAVVVVTIMLLPVGLFLYRRHQSELALEEAIAETNRLEPGWRLADLVKRQSALPREQNAAVPIAAAHAILANWKLDPQDAAEDKKLLPHHELDQQLLEALRKNREPYLPARAEALKAIPLKTGWYPSNLSFDANAGGIRSDQVFHVGKYLRGLAMLQIQDGNHDDAWLTTLAILATGRSLGDEAGLMGIMFRASLQSMAASNFERWLAQGATTDASLAEAMKCLADEAAVPLFCNAIRCGRAGIDETFTRLDDGRLQRHQLDSDFNGETRNFDIDLAWLRGGGTFKGAHASMLRHYNDALAIAKLPFGTMVGKIKELDQRLMDEGLNWAGGGILLGVGSQLAETRVKLECAVVGLGVERFRLKHGRWPESLDEVVAAKLLESVPLDGFDGKPLRYRKTTDGVVVFSVGPAGNYAGDALDARGKSSGSVNANRFEFRLWDENQRRQGPLPAINVVQKKNRP